MFVTTHILLLVVVLNAFTLCNTLLPNKILSQQYIWSYKKSIHLLFSSLPIDPSILSVPKSKSTNIRPIEENTLIESKFEPLLNDFRQTSSVVSTISSNSRVSHSKILTSESLIEILPTMSFLKLSKEVWSFANNNINININTNTNNRDYYESYSTLKKQIMDRLDSIITLEQDHSEFIIGNILRLMNGFVKIGIQWKELPESFRTIVLSLVQSISKDSTNSKSKEFISYIYLLGQSGFKIEDMPTSSLNLLFHHIHNIIDTLSSQSFITLIHGLGKIGLLWDKLPSNIVSSFIHALEKTSYDIKVHEINSIYHSLALMKVDWTSLPVNAQESLKTSLINVSSELSKREICNLIWSLGKIGYKIAPSSRTNDIFLFTLLFKFNHDINNISLFDMESVMVGLGLLEIDFKTLPLDLQQNLQRRTIEMIPSMNIFCIYNVLWGYARMHCNKYMLDKQLSILLISKVVAILHTFLPSQIGDIFWSLGSMKYKYNDLERSSQDRILAIASRIYLKLSSRAAVYVLWGLGKMEYRWNEDMMRSVKSRSDGDEVIPLALSVIKYLRNNVPSMNGKDISILLYSLGELKMPWNMLSTNVKSKIENQITILSLKISSRGISNSLYGLARCGALWNNFSDQMKGSIINSLVHKKNDRHNHSNVSYNNTSSITDKLQYSGDGDGDGGIRNMNSFEISQTIFSMGLLNVSWSTLPLLLQQSIITEVSKYSSMMTSHGRCNCLWGFASMNVSSTRIPSELISLVIQDLKVDPTTDPSVRSIGEFTERYVMTLKSIAMLKLSLSTNDIDEIHQNYRSTVSSSLSSSSSSSL